MDAYRSGYHADALTIVTTKLHWNFSSILKDAPDIHRFSARKWVST